MEEELILNRYRPLEKAGAGAFGTVQVAWDTTIQRKVAIKCICLSDADAFAYHTDGAQNVGAVRSASQPEDNPLATEAGDVFADAALAQMAAGLDDRTYQPMLPGNTGGFDKPTEFFAEEEPQGTGLLARMSRLFRGHEDTVALPGAEDAPAEDEPQGDHWLSSIPGLDEARTAAKLTDAHIVAVYDFQVVGNMAYLIMEYVEGITLTRLLRDYDDRLSLDIIGALFQDVAHGLSAAHGAGVLHLDVKPDNILIDKRGQAKVTDFGLATLCDAQGNGHAGGGTIGYMPPEQLSERTLDARCDEWALASIAYEMLAGKNPFFARSLNEALERIDNAELVLPSLCWQGIGAAVDDAVFTGLEPDPDDRFATVAEFAAALQPCLGDVAVGHQELAAIVEEAAGASLLDTVPASLQVQPESFVEEELPPAEPVVPQPTTKYTAQRAGGHFFGIWARVFGFLFSSAVMLLACINLPLFSTFSEPFIAEILGQVWPAALEVTALQNSVLWALVVFTGVLSLIKPSWGALVALVGLGVSAAWTGNIVMGLIFIAVTALWWYCTGRHGASQSNCGLLYIVLGAFGFAPFAPLATGIGMRVLDAAMTALFGIFACLTCACFGSGDIMDWGVLANWNFAEADLGGMLTKTLSNVGNWIIAASWFIAAVVGGLCTMPRQRWVNILGTVIAVCCLMAGLCGAAYVTSGHVTWVPETVPLVKTIICCLVAIAAACIFVPAPYVKKAVQAAPQVEEQPVYTAPKEGRLEVDITPRTRKLGK